jgi:Flp pilus assembly protein CpaB
MNKITIGIIAAVVVVATGAAGVVLASIGGERREEGVVETRRGGREEGSASGQRRECGPDGSEQVLVLLTLVVRARGRDLGRHHVVTMSLRFNDLGVSWRSLRIPTA